MPNHNPPANFQDLTGQKFGMLTVHHQNGRSNGRVIWRCTCICGKVMDALTARLRNGNASSCGCEMRFKIARAKTTHGQSRSRLGQPKSGAYASWAAMHCRCKSDAPATRRIYKDRGITVCKRWSSFENFYADMGDRPPGKSLDRKNNDRGYMPSNCRWATPQEQRMNQRHMKGRK